MQAINAESKNTLPRANETTTTTTIADKTTRTTANETTTTTTANETTTTTANETTTTTDNETTTTTTVEACNALTGLSVDAKSDHKCKICFQQFKSLQDCLKHELLRHSYAKVRPQKTLRNKLNIIQQRLKTEDTQTARAQLRNALKDCKPGDELAVICKQFCVDVSHLEMVYSRIYNCLYDELNGTVEVHPFGSFVSGLALKDCDVDLYLEDKSSSWNYDNGETRRFFNKVNSMLHRSKCFENVIAIRQARVPIIKCTHTPTGFNLDINMCCPSSVENTNFIHDLIQREARLHELLIFLKLWAKQLELIGHGDMTSYCFMTLAVFFLQNKSLLPSVKEMQQNATPIIILGVNYAYDINVFRPWPNEINIIDLVREFFKFYKDFDFKSQIISPYLGKTVPITAFLNGTYKFPEYGKQMDDIVVETDEEPSQLQVQRSVCVQDLFCLNLNIAKSMTSVSLTFFRECTTQSYRICCDIKQKDAEIFEHLIYGVIDDITKSPVFIGGKTPAGENTSAGQNTSAGENTSNGSPLCYRFLPSRTETRVLATYMSQKTKDLTTVPLTELQDEWTQHYIAAIKEILTDIYCIDLNTASPKHSDKHQRLENTDCTHTWQIHASVDMWTGRQHQRKSLQTFMQFQREQTERFISERRQNDQYAIKMDGFFTLHASLDNKFVEVSVQPLGDITTPVFKANPLYKFFTMFKCSMQNFNLKERLMNLSKDKE